MIGPKPELKPGRANCEFHGWETGNEGERPDQEEDTEDNEGRSYVPGVAIGEVMRRWRWER